jgi:hypothetical protein
MREPAAPGRTELQPCSHRPKPFSPPALNLALADCPGRRGPGRMMANREDPVGDNLKATPDRVPSLDRSAGCRLPPLEALPCQESAAPAT